MPPLQIDLILAGPETAFKVAAAVASLAEDVRMTKDDAIVCKALLAAAEQIHAAARSEVARRESLGATQAEEQLTRDRLKAERLARSVKPAPPPDAGGADVLTLLREVDAK